MKKELWPELKKLHPVVANLPEELKDPKCFKRIEKKIFEASKTGHDHKSLITWNKCKHCQQKFLERRALVKKLGFATYEQYLTWKKIMDIIVNKREIYLPKA